MTPNVDAETRLQDDDHVSVRLLLRMLACTRQIEGHLRQFMQSKFDTTLSRFDLMAQLERVPDGLRMSEISQRMMVTGGNVTGITNALEEEGLVVRATDAVDGRVFRVKLTAEGRTQFARMARDHERYVIELFGPLSMKDKKQLLELLGELKRRISA